MRSLNHFLDVRILIEKTPAICSIAITAIPTVLHDRLQIVTSARGRFWLSHTTSCWGIRKPEPDGSKDDFQLQNRTFFVHFWDGMGGWCVPNLLIT